MDRGLNLLVALACQGSPILDSLLLLGLVQTALGPLKAFSTLLEAPSPASSQPNSPLPHSADLLVEPCTADRSGPSLDGGTGVECSSHEDDSAAAAEAATADAQLPVTSAIADAALRVLEVLSNLHMPITISALPLLSHPSQPNLQLAVSVALPDKKGRIGVA